MSNITYWKNRWKTLAYEIRFIFLASFMLILSIELCLSYFPAFNEFCYKFGLVVIKLSYSLTSATIFYFLVQHMPKERKRIKLHRLLSYKILYIESQTDLLCKSLFGEENTEEMSLIRCSNLLSNLSEDEEIEINDMFFRSVLKRGEYFKASMANMLIFCNDVLPYNEYLDSKTLHRISTIKSICEMVEMQMHPVSKNLRKYDHYLFKIIQNKIELSTAFQNYSKSYSQESREITKHKNKDGESIQSPVI